MSCYSEIKMGRGEKRLEVLTPYEIELLPKILNELDKVNMRFYQMVSYQWLQALKNSKETESAKTKRSSAGSAAEVLISQSNKSKPSISLESCCFEGSALRELITHLVKTLIDRGALDAECELMIHDYKLQRQSRCRTNAFAQENNCKKKRAYFVRRSTFNAGDQQHLMMLPSSADAFAAKSRPSNASFQILSPSIRNSSSSDSSSSSVSPQTNRIKGARRWLLQRASSVQRATTIRERRAMAKLSDLMFVKLGELLLSEFHTTVYANPQIFDIDEREIKMLVWRHFTLMFVSLLNSRESYPF